MDVQQFEQAILKLAFETNARITAASVAYYLGIPSRDANRMLNELLREGVLELDSDEHGNLYYHVPHHEESSFAPLNEVVESMQPPHHGHQDPQHVLQQHATLTSPDDDHDVPAHSPRQYTPAPQDDGSDGLWLSSPDEPVARTNHPPAHVPPHAKVPSNPHHPYDDDSGYGAQATPESTPIFDHPAIERHSNRVGNEQPTNSNYRQVLVGVTSRPMEPDAWIGNCGASPVVVTNEARCEPKPLADARPSFVSCVDPEEESRVRAVHFEPAAPQDEMNNWWQPQPQQGAMVLAHSNNLPATMDQLEQPEHQPGMALLLSLILCGTGQIYNGEVSKGIMMMVLCFLLWFVLLGWVVHIWSIVDAVVVAERINRKQHV